MTPKNEAPVIARTVPSLVVDDVGFALEPLPVPVPAAALLVVIPVGFEEVLVAVGVRRPVKMTELVSV